MDQSTLSFSLPRGTVLRSTGNTYICDQILSISSRTLTALCHDPSGRPSRLKLFCGPNSMTDPLMQQLCRGSAPGILVPADCGFHCGKRFLVFSQTHLSDLNTTIVMPCTIAAHIVPQLNAVLHHFHESRVLLRDISPDHILYDTARQEVRYCGFSNPAVLPGRATVTGAPGYGQPPSFLAPEVPSAGYSTYSDYFALGVTLLCLVCGNNPLQSLSAAEIRQNLCNFRIPGVDIQHLKNLSYSYYSTQDKLLYLILGLLNPNPENRWGYEEIRCWCCGSHIPLVRRSGRIEYQFTAPFLVDTEACWNYRQLAQALAGHQSAWSQRTVAALDAFCISQKLKGWKSLSIVLRSKKQTASSKIFRCIYGYAPALDGFWWNGVKYPNMETMVHRIAGHPKQQKMLSEILSTGCLSFFLERRRSVSAVSQTLYQEILQFEALELQNPGQGAARCIMRFAASADSRSFQFCGTAYTSFSALLQGFRSRPTELKQHSAQLLQQNDFQSWLWASGLSTAAAEAARISRGKPEQAFYLLLSLIEKQSRKESTLRLARQFYLFCGEFSPIFWLKHHLNQYQMKDITGQVLVQAFEELNLSLTQSLSQLDHTCRAALVDYQNFVIATASSGAARQAPSILYYPCQSGAIFSKTWDNGIEVCPNFLYDLKYSQL